MDGVAVDEALLPGGVFAFGGDEVGPAFGFPGADAAGAAEHLLDGGHARGGPPPFSSII
ncbi:hypothetical protein [Amycolatopsis sp. NPDC059021]|uniref:hypothetical protein n=1 Tax=Amycolatopsis sp. NPDC059021 TaxID=3346704 RepID=UPI0036704248